VSGWGGDALRYEYLYQQTRGYSRLVCWWSVTRQSTLFVSADTYLIDSDGSEWRAVLVGFGWWLWFVVVQLARGAGCHGNDRPPAQPNLQPPVHTLEGCATLWISTLAAKPWAVVVYFPPPHHQRLAGVVFHLCRPNKAAINEQQSLLRMDMPG
jgi:hypothetical protein